MTLDHTIALLALFVILALALGPVGFFLTLGARNRLTSTQDIIRSLEARLTHTQLQLDRLQQGETPPVAASRAPDAPAEKPAEHSAAEPAEEAPPAEAPAVDARNALPEPPKWRSAISRNEGGETADPAFSPAATVPTPKGPGLEERLGTRWTVWIGGLALALGALLLVRYAIDQGFFGPGMRVALGLALALVLIGAGEHLRRREITEAPTDASGQAGGPGEGDGSGGDDNSYALVPNMAPPSIPAMLTASGTIAAFGSIFAAHGLYGFIGPAFAFIALGATGVATMFAAGLHGPMLAGIGLAGSLGAPLLVSSNAPSPWPVILYLLAVAAATYGLARIRRWLWLALAAAIGAGLWTFLFLEPIHSTSIGFSFYQAALVHLTLQSALALFVLGYEPYRNDPDSGSIERLPAFVAAGVVILAVIVQGAATTRLFGAIWIVTAIAIPAMLAANGYLLRRASPAMAAAGLLCVAALANWPGMDWRTVETTGILGPVSPGAYAAYALLVTTGLAAIAAWCVLRDANLSRLHTAVYASTAAITPLLALIAAYGRMTAGAQSTLYAALAAGLALAFAVVAQIFRNGVSDRKSAAWDLALGIFASAAIGALALAFTFALEGGTLTIALALAALGAAFTAVRLDIPALRWCTTGLALVLAVRFAWEPRIVHDLGPTPVFNWLLAGYGIPALSFGAAAWILRKAFGEDRPVRIVQAMAIFCTALLVYFEIRHFVFAGDPLAPHTRLVEQGLFAIASFGFAIVLMRMDANGSSPVFRYASYAFGIASAAISLFGLGIAHNPFLAWRGEPVGGGAFFNILLLAYLIPGLMALLVGRLADGIRPRWYVTGARIVAMALIFSWLTLQVRRSFQGPFIGIGRYTSDAEWYAYSACWLAFGIVLLAYGLWRKSVEVRIASALFIVLSVVKVFLFDLAGLDGILRALSFIGLGGVLIGIGLVYQKYVFARPSIGAAPQTATGD